MAIRVTLKGQLGIHFLDMDTVAMYVMERDEVRPVPGEQGVNILFGQIRFTVFHQAEFP
jgi:hypothetical protein